MSLVIDNSPTEAQELLEFEKRLVKLHQALYIQFGYADMAGWEVLAGEIQEACARLGVAIETCVSQQPARRA